MTEGCRVGVAGVNDIISTGILTIWPTLKMSGFSAISSFSASIASRVVLNSSASNCKMSPGRIVCSIIEPGVNSSGIGVSVGA